MRKVSPIVLPSRINLDTLLVESPVLSIVPVLPVLIRPLIMIFSVLLP